MWRDAVVARSRCSPTRSSSTCRRSSRASPARSGRRTGCACQRRRRAVQRRARGDLQEARRAARRGRRRGFRHRPWRRDDRRDHQLHQHLQPVGAGRRRPRRPQGARAGPRHASPGSRPASRPGSQVVTDYLDARGPQRGSQRDRLQPGRLWLHHLHRQFGAARPEPISAAIADNDLVAASVLSGNRNFEGRVSPDCRANYLASPPLVVAYALMGTVRERHEQRPRSARARTAQDVYPAGHLADQRRGPRADRRPRPFATCSAPAMPTSITATSAGARSRSPAATPTTGPPRSTYIQNPPYFEGMTMTPEAADRHHRRAGAGRVRRFDHHRPHLARPARSSSTARPAPTSATTRSPRADFNSYGARRGNHRSDDARHLRQHPHPQPMLAGVEGGMTRYAPTGETHADLRRGDALSRRTGTPLVVLAGKEYGTGSSRDWAAKGTDPARRPRRHRRELRAHPPLQPRRHGRASAPVPRRRGRQHARPRRQRDLLDRRRRRASSRARTSTVKVTRADGSTLDLVARCRIDTYNELEYYRAGGILHYVLRNLAA